MRNEKPTKNFRKKEGSAAKIRKTAIGLFLFGLFTLSLACDVSGAVTPTMDPAEQAYATQEALLPEYFTSIQTTFKVNNSYSYSSEDQETAQVEWERNPITFEPRVKTINDPTVSHPCNSIVLPRPTVDNTESIDVRKRLCEKLESAGRLIFIPEERLSEFVLTSASKITVTDSNTLEILCREISEGCYLNEADQVILANEYFEKIDTVVHEIIGHRGQEKLEGKQYIENEDACIKTDSGIISVVTKLKDYPNYPFPIDQNETRYAVLIIDPEIIPTLIEELIHFQIGGKPNPYLANASPEILEFIKIISQKMIDNPEARLPQALIPEIPFDQSPIPISRLIKVLSVLFDGRGAAGLVRLGQDFNTMRGVSSSPSEIDYSALEACQ